MNEEFACLLSYKTSFYHVQADSSISSAGEIGAPY